MSHNLHAQVIIFPITGMRRRSSAAAAEAAYTISAMAGIKGISAGEPEGSSGNVRSMMNR